MPAKKQLQIALVVLCFFSKLTIEHLKNSFLNKGKINVCFIMQIRVREVFIESFSTLINKQLEEKRVCYYEMIVVYSIALLVQ